MQRFVKHITLLESLFLLVGIKLASAIALEASEQEAILAD